MDYKASFDLTVKIVTSLVILVFIVLNYLLLSAIFNGPDGPFRVALVSLAIAVIPLNLILIYIYFTHVIKYEIRDGNLVIVSPARKLKFKCEDIESAEMVPRGQLSGVTRTFGNGGFLGYTGKFTSDTLGSFTMYATQAQNCIIIRIKNGKKIMISPDDVGLLTHLNESCAGRLSAGI